MRPNWHPWDCVESLVANLQHQHPTITTRPLIVIINNPQQRQNRQLPNEGGRAPKRLPTLDVRIHNRPRLPFKITSAGMLKDPNHSEPPNQTPPYPTHPLLPPSTTPHPNDCNNGNPVSPKYKTFITNTGMCKSHATSKRVNTNHCAIGYHDSELSMPSIKGGSRAHWMR